MSTSGNWWTRLAYRWPFSTPRDPDAPFGGWGPQVPIWLALVLCFGILIVGMLSGFRLADARTIRLGEAARDFVPELAALKEEGRSFLRSYNHAVRVVVDMLKTPLPSAELDASAAFANRSTGDFNSDKGRLIVSTTRIVDGLTPVERHEALSRIFLSAALFADPKTSEQLHSIARISVKDRATLFGEGAQVLERLISLAGSASDAQRSATHIERLLIEQRTAAKQAEAQYRREQKALDDEGARYIADTACINVARTQLNSCVSRPRTSPARPAVPAKTRAPHQSPRRL